MTVQVEGAKLVGGVWLPATEGHFVEMMERNKKNHRVVDGKLTYQYRKLEDALNRIPKDRRRVCIDIGAHVGLWAMWLCQHFQHVHCFEPIKLHGDILPHNMPKDNYTLHRCALGEHECRVNIEVPEKVTGNAHVVHTGDDGAIPCYPLDKFTAPEAGEEEALIEGAIDFIKIDVEGFELQVVRGAEKTLRKHKPFMVLEQKGNDTKFMGQQRNSALAWCQSIGMVSLSEIGGDHFLGWR